MDSIRFGSISSSLFARLILHGIVVTPECNSFTISASNDPSFKTSKIIYSGTSSGQTMAPESYDITDLTRKYVRITVTGNSENNNWASITGVNINAGDNTPPTDCKTPAITRAGISASGSDANLPQNTLDNNANTRWSNLGLPSWIQYNLGTSQQAFARLILHGIVGTPE